MLERLCYARGMTTPKKKRSRDNSQLAEPIVADAAAENNPSTTDDGKNPHAVALGRMGGLKGGVERAKKLSEGRRKEIAQEAARARWAKTPKKKPF